MNPPNYISLGCSFLCILTTPSSRRKASRQGESRGKTRARHRNEGGTKKKCSRKRQEIKTEENFATVEATSYFLTFFLFLRYTVKGHFKTSRKIYEASRRPPSSPESSRVLVGIERFSHCGCGSPNSFIPSSFVPVIYFIFIYFFFFGI